MTKVPVRERRRRLKEVLSRPDRRPTDYGLYKNLDFPMSRVIEWARNIDFYSVIRGRFDTVTWIPHGGLIPAATLVYYLNRSNIRVVLRPLNEIKPDTGRVLIIDDIVDSGTTIETVLRNYTRAKFAAVCIRRRIVRDWGTPNRPYLKSGLPFYAIVNDTAWIRFPWERA